MAAAEAAAAAVYIWPRLMLMLLLGTVLSRASTCPLLSCTSRSTFITLYMISKWPRLTADDQTVWQKNPGRQSHGQADRQTEEKRPIASLSNTYEDKEEIKQTCKNRKTETSRHIRRQPRRQARRTAEMQSRKEPE